MYLYLYNVPFFRLIFVSAQYISMHFVHCRLARVSSLVIFCFILSILLWQGSENIDDDAASVQSKVGNCRQFHKRRLARNIIVTGIHLLLIYHTG